MVKQKYKAIIFDLDGTIVDTERVFRPLYIKAFKHYGYKLTHKQNMMLRSLGHPYMDKTLYEWYGKYVDYKQIEKYTYSLYDEFAKTHKLKVKKGIKKVLAWLKANKYIIAIATSSKKEVAIARLKEVKLDKCFNYILSACDVKRGKPAPDTYKYICKQLGFNPKDCLAIEDSPNGVMSAYSSGLNTIMIPDLTKPDKSLLKLNIKVLDDASQIINLLK